MGRCKLLAIWLFTTVSLLVATRGDARDEDLRTWTDSTGKHKRVAAFQKLEGDSVYLRTKDGKETKVPLEKLSEADQSYARNAAPVDAVPDPFQESAKTPSPAGQAVAEVELDDASQTADPNLRVVVAEGVGTNVEQAKKDAYRDAVRQVVGAYVDSSQLLKNDKLIEDRITTLSSAFVEKASQPLTKVTEDGIVRVKVKAWVRLTKVLETLKKNNVELKVDTPSFAAELQTRADQAEGADALMARVFADYPARAFKASLVGKPEITKATASDTTIRIGVKIEADLEQYMVIAQKIDAALTSIAADKGGFSSDGKKFAPNTNYESSVRYWLQHGILDEGCALGLVLPPNDMKRLESEQQKDYSCKSVTGLTFFNLLSTEDTQKIEDFQSGKWEKIAPQGSDKVVFLLMTKANGSGQRTQWKWFVLDEPVGRQWFLPACRKMLVTLTLMNDDRKELIEDRFALSHLGWRLIYGTPCVYVCAPYFVGFRDGAWYTPSFTYTRQLDAETAEVEGLASIQCRLENGELLDEVPGVTD